MLVQTVHLSCTDTNTVSKRTETSFRLGLVTKEYYQMCSKWFMRLWYVWCKSCTYLALTLTLSPNKPNQDCTWCTSSGSSIRCVHNEFWACGLCWRKPCTYLPPTLTLSPNRPKWDSTWPTSPRSSIGCIQNDFGACGMFGTNYAPILHWHKQCLQIDQNEIAHDPCHVVIPSGVSKIISEPVVHSVQTVHLSCTDTNTVSKQTETRIHMTHVT
jgi:hypothetical protein